MIESHLRFRPFSREIPTFVPIPGTTYGAKIFPARVEIFSLGNGNVLLEKEFSFGPLDQFLVTLNLERMTVEVSGFVGKECVRYEIRRDHIHAVKGFSEDISFAKDESPFNSGERERLSLGCAKSQDITLMMRRGSLEELVPFWYFLSQSFPLCEDGAEKGDSLFHELESAVTARDKTVLAERLLSVLRTAFTSLFLPHVGDDFHLGFKLPLFALEKTPSPLLLFRKSFPLLRSLFFQEHAHSCEILPLLPPQFHAGRMTHMKTARGHALSIEWTKKAPRRIFFEAASDDSFAIKFPHDIKRFRLRLFDRTVGTVLNGSEVSLEAGKRYLLDRFER